MCFCASFCMKNERKSLIGSKFNHCYVLCTSWDFIKQNICTLGLIVISKKFFSCEIRLRLRRLKREPDPPATGRGSVPPSLLTTTQQGQARDTHGTAECAHVTALMSSALQHRKGANVLPYLPASCHHPSSNCPWAHPHVTQTGAISSGRNRREELPAWHLCTTRGEINVSSHLWLSRCFWLHTTTTHTCCYLSS